METFSKGVALFFFAAGIILLILTLLNYGIGFAAADWLNLSFWRLYLFLAVTGILVYILIRFRRKEGK
ncbi:hypothetical protein QWY22_17050 [Planococcus liqunii]|uniref:hypothetical protein n=1 Tax=Planococcus liqunii TaxID=3058394 RepID=UPI002636FE94|nr:hypothetical protein [Planococcus sp. N056]WKA50588.1 hypothetical protein QWY22_17050 [Planococcus sp. N056]